MSHNDDNEFSHSPNLLPFGGFEVATLLSMISSGERAFIEKRHDQSDFQPTTATVSSGWLRSKIMAG